MTTTTQRADVYTRVTGKIIADLTQGVRPWHRPWQAEYAAGRITRPLPVDNTCLLFHAKPCSQFVTKPTRKNHGENQGV